MDLVLSEDQEFIAQTARDFVEEKSPLTRVRELRDTGDATGFSRPLWKEMADLGWAGILYPEDVGGAGMGFAELVVVMEELGRTLAPEPFLSTVLLGGQALALSGNEALAKEWLTRICAGEAIVALGYQEARSRYDLGAVDTRAEADGDGFRLTGEKVQVLDGHVADAIVVSAQADAGPTLFLVPAGAAGLSVTRQTRLDSRNAALVRLDGVSVGPEAVLGGIGGGGALLEQVVDRATVGLCAEMLGGMQQAFALSIEYLKTREQFDTVIGTFQALKHRAADLFIEIELCKSAVMAAARALDAGDADVAGLVSVAKAKCSDAYVLAGNEGVQFFGGVGMTDEYDIGLYMKRARAAELTFGDAAHHRDRWATLAGY